MITKRVRNWWRNFETVSEVELRLAGKRYTGMAEIRDGDTGGLEFMTDYLKRRPIDAKAYGLKEEEISLENVAPIIPHIVLIRIEVDPAE